MALPQRPTQHESPRQNTWFGDLIGRNGVPVVVREQLVAVPNWPAALDGLRIAHVSDLHIARWDATYEAAQQALQHTAFDLLAVTGDFCVWPRCLEPAASLTRRFFSPIRAPLGQFAILGNHDIGPFVDAVAGSGLDFVGHGSRVLVRNGQPLNLVGLDGGPDRRRLYVDQAMRTRQPDAPTIVLCHYPSAARHLGPYGVALALAGHTHGGQWRWPVLGCLWANDAIPRQCALGLVRWRGVQMHVTAGLGAAGPIRRRINCPPEIAILELRRAGPAQSLRETGQD